VPGTEDPGPAGSFRAEVTASVAPGPVGIIGAGRLGQALVRTVRRAGRTVVLSNRRGADSLTPIILGLGDGVSAGQIADAAACNLVILAVPWTSVPDALTGLEWAGQVVVDATNAVLIPSLEPAPLDGRTSSEIVAELVPRARLVKAANTLQAVTLGNDPVHDEGRRVLFISGDDELAKADVAKLFNQAGFFTIDLGSLAAGGALQQAGAPLAGHDLIRLLRTDER
jgi:8-hydroxy-5-deazaflavin:NADPH oxidoreductase